MAFYDKFEWKPVDEYMIMTWPKAIQWGDQWAIPKLGEYLVYKGEGYYIRRRTGEAFWTNYSPPPAPVIDDYEDEAERSLAQKLSDLLYNTSRLEDLDPHTLLEMIKQEGWVPVGDVYQEQALRREVERDNEALQARVEVYYELEERRNQKERAKGFEEANSKMPTGVVSYGPYGIWIKWRHVGEPAPLVHLPESHGDHVEGLNIKYTPTSHWDVFFKGGITPSWAGFTAPTWSSSAWAYSYVHGKSVVAGKRLTGGK